MRPTSTKDPTRLLAPDPLLPSPSPKPIVIFTDISRDIKDHILQATVITNNIQHKTIAVYVQALMDKRISAECRHQSVYNDETQRRRSTHATHARQS